MVKLMALYGHPQDADTFDQVYYDKHVPLVKKMPGLRRLEIDRITGAPNDKPAYYLVASLHFDDVETMQRSMASEESRAAARVLRELGAEVSMVLADGDGASGARITAPTQPMARPPASFGFEKIIYQKGDGRATITINRPKIYNALDFQTLQEMGIAFQDASWDDSIAVVVLTGAGDKAFCTGADLKEMQQLVSERQQDYWKWMSAFLEAQDRLRNVGKPTIARLNGITVGGGNEFNLGCDLAVATDDVYICQVDLSRGAVPAGGATQWLPLLVGDRRAREIMWLGEEISAQTALEWGLVNRVVPRDELDSTVDEMVAKLKNTLPENFRYARQQTNFWKDLSWHTTVGHARDWLSVHSSSTETQEGMRAFVEKRPIDYAGLRAGTVKPAAHDGARANGSAQHCPHCNADLPPGFAYCGRCGQPLS